LKGLPNRVWAENRDKEENEKKKTEDHTKKKGF